LENDLFSCLRGDAPEGDAGLHRHHHRVAKLGIGHVLARRFQRHFRRVRLDRLDDFLFKEDVRLACQVNARLDALVVADIGVALVSGDERLREGVHHHLTRQSAQLDNLVESQGEIAFHGSAWFCPTGTHAINGVLRKPAIYNEKWGGPTFLSTSRSQQLQYSTARFA